MDTIRLTEPVIVHLNHNDPPMSHVDPDGISRKILGIQYGIASEMLKLDIYYPEKGEGPFPTVIFYHGGAFWGGERDDFQCVYALNGIFHGYAVVSVDYRLSDEEKFPAAVYDSKAAVRFLRANSEKYNLDPLRFAVMGNSAGGYMAAMVGLSAGNAVMRGPDAEYADVDDSAQVAVCLFGAYDLTLLSEHFKQTLSADGSELPISLNCIDYFVGLECRNHPGLMRLAWPGAYVTKNCPNILIQAGTADELIPVEDAAALAERINDVCGEGRAVLQMLEGATHGDDAYSTKENEKIIFDFLDKHLKHNSKLT